MSSEDLKMTLPSFFLHELVLDLKENLLGLPFQAAVNFALVDPLSF